MVGFVTTSVTISNILDKDSDKASKLNTKLIISHGDSSGDLSEIVLMV